MNKEIEKIKDCIDSVYGSDCAYYGVDGLAIAAALYKAGCRFQREVVDANIATPTSKNVIEFPCKVGDAVWIVYTPRYPANPSDKGKWFMSEDGVQRLIYGAKGISIETWNMGTMPAKEIGKKIFFTKEEAEKALAVMKGGAE